MLNWRQMLLLLLSLLLWCLGDAKKLKVTPSPPPSQTRKACHRQGDDTIFTRTFSVTSMQRYCEMLDSFSLILRSVNEIWRRIATPNGSCYDENNWVFHRSDYGFVLKAMFRHHIDLDGDGRMSSSERERFFAPALQYHLLPGLLDSEYRHLLDSYFRTVGSPSEETFVSLVLRMMHDEWRTLTKRMLPDLDGDSCVTRIEFARAVCRKRIGDFDLYFRVADLDNNRAVTSPEFGHFRSLTSVQPDEEPGARKFFGFFDAMQSMIANYTADYYQQTSYAHDDMITFNEVNLYICEYVI